MVKKIRMLKRKIIPYTGASLAKLDADVCVAYPQGVTGKKRYFSVPRFLIIGAAKCGTQELVTWLGQHPNLQASEEESNFFNDVINIEEEWGRYVLNPSFLISKQQRHVINLPKYTFEKTPVYLWKKNRNTPIPELVKKMMPSGKFIVILRNPTDRAYSVFRMNKRGTTINPPWTRRMPDTFEEYILEKGSVKASRNIIQVGHYAKYLKTWMSYFSRKQILVVTLDEFKKKPFELLTKIQTFLDIPIHDYQPSALQTERGFWGLNNQPSKAYNKPYEPINPETKQILDNHYAPWNEELRELFPKVNFPW